jgi:hypothetical protein
MLYCKQEIFVILGRSSPTVHALQLPASHAQRLCGVLLASAMYINSRAHKLHQTPITSQLCTPPYIPNQTQHLSGNGAVKTTSASRPFGTPSGQRQHPDIPEAVVSCQKRQLAAHNQHTRRHNAVMWHLAHYTLSMLSWT